MKAHVVNRCHGLTPARAATFCLVLQGLAATGSTAAEEIGRGLVLSLSCAACHGTDGASPGAMPGLTNLDAAAIEAALLAFRSGQRQGTMMNRIASGYSEEEIAAIAAYFGSLKR